MRVEMRFDTLHERRAVVARQHAAEIAHDRGIGIHGGKGIKVIAAPAPQTQAFARQDIRQCIREYAPRHAPPISCRGSAWCRPAGKDG